MVHANCLLKVVYSSKFASQMPFFLLLAFQSSGQVPVLRLSIDYVVFATLTRMAMFKSGITVVIVIYSMVMSEAIPCLLELSSLFPFLDSHCQ